MNAESEALIHEHLLFISKTNFDEKIIRDWLIPGQIFYVILGLIFGDFDQICLWSHYSDSDADSESTSLFSTFICCPNPV